MSQPGKPNKCWKSASVRLRRSLINCNVVARLLKHLLSGNLKMPLGHTRPRETALTMSKMLRNLAVHPLAAQSGRTVLSFKGLLSVQCSPQYRDTRFRIRQRLIPGCTCRHQACLPLCERSLDRHNTGATEVPHQLSTKMLERPTQVLLHRAFAQRVAPLSQEPFARDVVQPHR